jgi:hypothetical protein
MNKHLRNAIQNVQDYYVDNCAKATCGWAMYAQIIANGVSYLLTVIPSDDEANAIDSGDAELDFIDYSNPLVTAM